MHDNTPKCIRLPRTSAERSVGGRKDQRDRDEDKGCGERAEGEDVQEAEGGRSTSEETIRTNPEDVQKTFRMQAQRKFRIRTYLAKPNCTFCWIGIEHLHH